ncbi:MAG: helix-turn-helix domain-containing protein [Firmicutes bacterium]|nr:helix-turn-helix domain-containing protein [Bacillota bacterium]
MYYPTQIPYKLNKEFSRLINYTEETLPSLSDFVICIWEMIPKMDERNTVTNVIVTDGCIDLVADFKYGEIGFAGFGKTLFDDKIKTPSRYMGARLKPGAFHAITGLDASMAMDKFLPLSRADKNFNKKEFFESNQTKTKQLFTELIERLCQNKTPNQYTRLFDELYDDLPDTACELYTRMGYSPKQCQRHFDRNFGLTPQVVLNILRFQKCLENPGNAMEKSNYYDQAHFIKDFKKHIGITPNELIKLYK